MINPWEMLQKIQVRKILEEGMEKLKVPIEESYSRNMVG
jgi:hypothetical protein